MTVSPYELLSNGPSAEYRAKMMHPIPVLPVVDREVAILRHCDKRVVLDIGSSGPMAEGIKELATKVYGLDREDAPGVVGFDLDDVSQKSLPDCDGVTLVVCGEVLEHLSNPGWFLARLRRQYPVPTLITVPNAFADVGAHWIQKGIECVNSDHVAYYSYWTLRELLRRAGYSNLAEWGWYRGKPGTAEGLIVLAEG